jgi:hypothetical protein
MSSVHDQYRSKVLYKHPSSVEARKPDAKPAASELEVTRSRHQIEASRFREEALNERRKLENSQKTRRARSPHASFDQKDHLESVALDKRLEDRRNALRAPRARNRCRQAKIPAALSARQ